MNEGLFIVRMDKHRATWNYFTTNPQGGGFGSNYCGPKYIALSKATYALQPGTHYRLIVNGKDCGVQRIPQTCYRCGQPITDAEHARETDGTARHLNACPLRGAA
jgi:hypothetical protein